MRFLAALSTKRTRSGGLARYSMSTVARLCEVQVRATVRRDEPEHVQDAQPAGHDDGSAVREVWPCRRHNRVHRTRGCTASRRSVPPQAGAADSQANRAVLPVAHPLCWPQVTVHLPSLWPRRATAGASPVLARFPSLSFLLLGVVQSGATAAEPASACRVLHAWQRCTAARTC